MTDDKKMIRVETEGSNEYYKKEHNSEVYFRVPTNPLTRPFTYGLLRTKRSRNILIVYDEVEIDANNDSNNENNIEEFY